MVAGTLDFLRANTVTEIPVKTDIDALIEDNVDDMRELGTALAVHGRVGIPIEPYPQAIRRCLANLVDNARRHAGGAISLRIERHAGKIMMHVDDAGPGIPPSERERVFEPYVRLDPSGGSQTGGSGLGLAIARAIARTHGGDISIADRAGGGQRTSLSQPLAAG